MFLFIVKALFLPHGFRKLEPDSVPGRLARIQSKGKAGIQAVHGGQSKAVRIQRIAQSRRPPSASTSGVKVWVLKASKVKLTVELTLQMVMAVVEDIKPDINTPCSFEIGLMR